MLIDARGRMFHLQRFAIQMLSNSGVGAFFIVITAAKNNRSDQHPGGGNPRHLHGPLLQ